MCDESAMKRRDDVSFEVGFSSAQLGETLQSHVIIHG
jgi:hypothetical protein